MISTGSDKRCAVVFYLPTFEPLVMGGAETQAKRLAKKLIAGGIEVFFITPGKKNLPEFEVIDSIPVYRFLTFHERISSSLKKKQDNLPAFVKKVCFDYTGRSDYELEYTVSKIGIKDRIAMLDLLVSAFWIFFKKRKRFSIVQINTVTFIAPIITLIARIIGKKVLIKDSTMNGLEKMHLTPFRNRSRKFLVNNASFVAMTETIYNNMLAEGVQPNKLFKIPNGIDFVEHHHEASNNGFNCLFVGNLYQQPAKGIDVLLMAWKTVVEKNPAAILTVVGDGNIEAYRSHVESEGLGKNVFFEGKQNPNKYYNNHDLFILPSRREGMSNSLMEAMLNGLPIVATAISGNIDLVENGVNGYLVPANNSAALAEAIVEALGNSKLRQDCVHLNPEKIYATCDLNLVSEKYKAVYQTILNN